MTALTGFAWSWHLLLVAAYVLAAWCLVSLLLLGIFVSAAVVAQRRTPRSQRWTKRDDRLFRAAYEQTVRLINPSAGRRA